MLIPHLGRHLSRCREKNRKNLLLLLCSLPGVPAALLPIVPGFTWCAKLAPLYPLLLLPLLMPASGMFLRKKPGGLTFLLLCLLPIGGAVLAMIGLGLSLAQGTSGNILFQTGADLTLWGYTVAALVLAFSSPAANSAQADFFPLPDSGGTGDKKGSRGTGASSGATPDASGRDIYDLPLNLEFKYNDLPPPDTRGAAVSGLTADSPRPLPETSAEPEYVPPAVTRVVNIPAEDEPWLDLADPQNFTAAYADGATRPLEAYQQAGQPEDTLYPTGAEEQNELTVINLEEPDGFTRQSGVSEPDFAPETEREEYPEESELPQDEEPPPPDRGLALPDGNLLDSLDDLKTRQNQAENITDNLESILSGLGAALANLDSEVRRNSPQPKMQSIFNLSNLVRLAHAETLPLAEAKGIALSWFVSPNLPLLYKGDEDSLQNALGYLLKGTVEYAESGVIQLTVRQSAGPDENFVQFSLTDNTINPQSARRPARVLSRAWELASASQGSFSINFLPDRGTSINFSLKLHALQDEDNVWASEKKAAGQVLARQRPDGDAFPDLSGIDISLEESAGTTEQHTEPEQADAQASGSMPEPEAEAVPPAEPESVVSPISIADISDFDELDLDLQEKAAEPADEPGGAAGPARDTIIVADLAASGRRLMARRLGTLPHYRLEARNAGEIVQGCAWGNVCLIIFDADMPENDVKKALREVNANEARSGRPPVPSLGLLSHLSQSARMRKIGCTECQVKTASREKFQELVLKLAPLPGLEKKPSPLAEPAVTQEQIPAQPDNGSAAKPKQKSAAAKPDRSVPMLDLIVSSLDEEENTSEFPDPLEKAAKLSAERTAARAARRK
jgi:hypothetical protein